MRSGLGMPINCLFLKESMKMKDEKQFRKYEMIMARDLIDLAREKSGDFSMLESLSDFCFSIMAMKDGIGIDGGVDWRVIFDELDNSYVKRKYIHNKIDEQYDKIVGELAVL